MHQFYKKASGLTGQAIGAAIEVHRHMGPGLLESVYEWCLCREFDLRKLSHCSQKAVVIEYRGFQREEPLRFDILIDDCLLLELTEVEKVLPIHKARALSYMKLLDVPLGLIINFNVMKLTDGVSRLILPGAGGQG
jgi:GxxExxY protein